VSDNEERPGLVTPKCCAAAQTYKAVVLSVDVYGDVPSNEVEPRWFVPTSAKDEIFDAAAIPRPTACPFCATPLPAPVRRTDNPRVCVVSDGGYYCDTCGERLRSCECLTPEQAYEIPTPDADAMGAVERVLRSMNLSDERRAAFLEEAKKMRPEHRAIYAQVIQTLARHIDPG
jgi:hypothetical protein